MTEDTGKRELYFQILNEIEKFNDSNNEQRLALIQKKIWPNDKNSKQKLNYYLQRFIKMELIRKVQSQPYAIYNLNVTGAAVKENLTTTENTHKIVTWGYENLLVGYKILYWGSWKFRPLGHRSRIRMTNWSYQLVKAGNGLQAKVQDTGLLLISGPSKIYGPDGDELKMKAHAMVQDAARWFMEHYDIKLGEPEIRRPGQKYLPNSTALCKILGNFKLGDYYINASPPEGEPHLEENDNSMSLENILKTFQETPGRLGNLESALDKLGPTIQDLNKNMQLHLEVMENIGQGVSELRAAVKDMSAGTGDTYPSWGGDHRSMDVSDEDIIVKVQFLKDYGAFWGKLRGNAILYDPKRTGQILCVSKLTAKALLNNQIAKLIKSDDNK